MIYYERPPSVEAVQFRITADRLDVFRSSLLIDMLEGAEGIRVVEEFGKLRRLEFTYQGKEQTAYEGEYIVRKDDGALLVMTEFDFFQRYMQIDDPRS